MVEEVAGEVVGEVVGEVIGKWLRMWLGRRLRGVVRRWLNLNESCDKCLVGFSG